MVFGFGANLSIWVWSRSNGIISASSNPTKMFHTTNPNPTKTKLLNPTISTSSATPSNDAILTKDYPFLLLLLLINRRESLALSHRSLSRKSSLFFQWNPLFPSFSPHQERSMIYSLLVCLWAPVHSGEEGWVSSGNGPTMEIQGGWRERERENLRLIFDEN